MSSVVSVPRVVTGVSIVIPAYNEEKYLPVTLEAVRVAGARLNVPFEVIVVDNLSTDRTIEVARSFGARVVSFEQRNISGVRNAGIREAAHPLVVTIDADCTMPEHGFEHIVALMSRGEDVGGAIALNLITNRPVVRVAVFLIQSAAQYLAGIQGALFFFWRDDALAFGGFDETRLVAEDSIFAQAMRRRGPFRLLRSVVMTTTDRKDTTIPQLLKMVPRVWRAYRGAAHSAADFDYWYKPKR